MAKTTFYKTAHTTINFDEPANSTSPSPVEFGAAANNNSAKKRKVQSHYPTARDGHAAVVYFGCLWIFGGDRHHMPFNDL